MAITVTSISPSTVYKRDWYRRITITGTGFSSNGFAVTFSDAEIEVLKSVYLNSTTGYVDVNIPDTCTLAAGDITVTTTAGGSGTGSGLLTIAAQIAPLSMPKPENIEGFYSPFINNEGKATQVKLDSSGNLPTNATVVTGDIELGAIEIKDATSDTRAVVKTDGVNNALVVLENGKSTGAYNQISVTDSATVVKAANLSRRMISVTNTGSAICYIGTDASVTTSNGHALYGYCTLTLGGYTGAVYAIFAAAGPTTVTYLEI